MMKKYEKSFACLFSIRIAFIALPICILGRRLFVFTPYFAFFNLNWRGVVISLLLD